MGTPMYQTLLTLLSHPNQNLAKLESDVEEDFESARANYKDLYDQSYSALGIAMDILRGSEHPRAIEVFSGLVNTTANMVEKLLNLHKLKMDMQKGMPQPDLSMLPGANITQNNTQNNITVGSTNDILKALAAMEEQAEEQQ